MAKKKMTEAEFKAASAKGKADFASAQKGAKTRAAVSELKRRKLGGAALIAGALPIGRIGTAAKAGVNALRGVATKMAQAKRLKGEAVSNRAAMQRAKGKEFEMTGGDNIAQRSGMGNVIKTAERQDNLRVLKNLTKREQDLMAKMSPSKKQAYLKSKRLDKKDMKSFQEGRSSVPENLRRYTK